MYAPGMYEGVSGLKSFSRAMQTVSDNLANVSTTGFKSTRAEFGDLLYSNLAVGGEVDLPGSNQTGQGTYVFATNNMSEGTIIDTQNATDLAINGRGFFLVTDETSGETYLTRDGSFYLDKEGYLVNQQGLRVQGYAVAADGTYGTGATTDLQVDTVTEVSAATSAYNFAVNLDADVVAHAANQAIDPNDASTFDHTTTYSVYEADGTTHAMVTYYQRMDSYTGAAPAGSQTVWKTATYEQDPTTGSLTLNPSLDNGYQLHFDTDGHLVGVTQGQTAAGDIYTYDQVLGAATDPISDQLGETLSYTGAAGGQTYISTLDVTFGAGAAGTEDLILGGTTYADLAGADDLAERLNASASGYWATVSGGTVTIYSDGVAPLSASTADDPGAALTLSGDTMQDVINAVDNGRAATGAIHLDLATMAAGDTVTVGGTSFVYNTDFTDAATLAAAIGGAGLGVGATAIGDSVFLSAAANGTAGNSVALGLGGTNVGTITISGATLAGGMDDSATSLVDASAATVTGGVSLRLARTDTGAAATLTLGTTNTLGQGLALDLNTATQNQLAQDSNVVVSTDGQATLDFAVSGGAVQSVTLDFSPDDDRISTMYAGGYDLWYSDQDGYLPQSLTSLDVTEDGVVWGIYSGGERLAVGAVAMGEVKNPAGLKREGDNLWSVTTESGNMNLTYAGDPTYGTGSIAGASLESSNVDMASEITNMIVYQRAWQANTKAITTSDEMIKTAIHLKA